MYNGCWYVEGYVGSIRYLPGMPIYDELSGMHFQIMCMMIPEKFYGLPDPIYCVRHVKSDIYLLFLYDFSCFFQVNMVLFLLQGTKKEDVSQTSPFLFFAVVARKVPAFRVLSFATSRT